jgi:hypothetical protein
MLIRRCLPHMTEANTTESRTPTEEAERALQHAAEACGEPLSQADYRSWRTQHPGSPPCVSTIAYRLADRSWTEACRSVGISSGKDGNRGNTGKPKTYTTEELAASINRAVKACGEPPTSREYTEWRGQQDDDLPSASIIATRLADGSWNEAVQGVNHD